MKSILIVALTLLSLGVQAKTVVTNNVGQYPSENSASIELSGSDAKKMWDFLSENIQYSGNYISEDAAMGKAFLNAPGIHCRALNESHMEANERKLENIYKCTIEFGSNGAIKL